MYEQELFTAEEWRSLQFGVLDVFMLVSQIDAESGMDSAEKNTFLELLEHPEFSTDELLRDVLASLAADYKETLEVYTHQYKFDTGYFEQSFTCVKAIVDEKLKKGDALGFKEALAIHLGGAIAHASGPGVPGLEHVEENELVAITSILKWLKSEVKK